MEENKFVNIKMRDLKKKYAKHRIDHALSQLTDTSTLKKARKEIARQYTLLRQKLERPASSAEKNNVDEKS